MEFHVSREARDRYEFNQTLFAFSGNVVFANLGASREFAFRMNERREAGPNQTIQPGALYAMGLIDEMSHALVEYYRLRLDPKVMSGALEWFDSRLGKEELDKTILAFVEQCPTADVYRKEKTPAEWLHGATGGIAHRHGAGDEARSPGRQVPGQDADALGLDHALQTLELCCDKTPGPPAG